MEIKQILEKLKNDEITLEQAEAEIKHNQYEDLGYAKIDHQQARYLLHQIRKAFWKWSIRCILHTNLHEKRQTSIQTNSSMQEREYGQTTKYNI